MTHQNEFCGNGTGQKENDTSSRQPSSNFLKVNSMRRRKNMQNRVSWHNSYTEKNIDEEDEGAEDSTNGQYGGTESGSLERAALNFRSTALADVGERNAQRTLIESDSTSSPSLFQPPLPLNTVVNGALELQSGLFSAPIIESGIFSFENGRQATSTEILPVISDSSLEKWTQRHGVNSNTVSDFIYDNLPPEPLVVAPQSSILNELTRECATENSHDVINKKDKEERRSSVTIVNGDPSGTADKLEDFIATLSEENAADSSATVCHKRSASDHVISSACHLEDLEENVASTSIKMEENLDDIDIVQRHLKEKSGQSSLNFVEAPPIDSRLSASTPSINEKTRSKDDLMAIPNVLAPIQKHFSSSTFNTFTHNDQYKTALLNSAAEVRLRGVVNSESSFDNFYQPTASTVSNGTFFKRSVEKEKKRENKTNSVILGTLLSIRQKKKSKDTRNLANVFPFNPVGANGSGGVAVVSRKESSPGFLDSKRSTHFSFSESKNGLPDVLQSVLSGGGMIKDGHNTITNAHSVSPGFETSQSFQFDDSISSFPPPRLIKQKWQDLDLWSNEAAVWSTKHPDLNLAATEKKRQNVIYEIYITEKHHCQVIVFLQQAYQVGLLNTGIMTPAEIKMLIPDVLDSLLDFHLRLLRRIHERIHASKTVNTISDIIFEEFEEGEYRNAAIHAYTVFCLARDDAHKVYALYMDRCANFRKFFDHYERDPEYKGRSFKSCLLLIAQRLTKYPLLIEQVLKLDSNANKVLSQRAHNAVKSFALKVDSELWLVELNRRWENLKKNMDKSSVGQLLGAPFTYDDLVHQSPDDPRKLLSISTVHWQSVTGQKIELSIVVFDDIVAFLHERNGVMQFFSQQDHASIIPLYTALIREMERTNEVMLIVLVKKKPDMYRLVFNNKTEMHNWICTFKKARLVAPQYVRTVRGDQHIDCGPPRINGSGADGDDIYGDPDEIAYNVNIQRWQKQLESMFAERMERESLLQEYFVDRLRFFDALRKHLRNFPSRIPRSDCGILPATMRVRENRDIERMKSVLRSRLKDLKENRRSTLNQLIETAQKARDSDLALFFDELYADGSIEEMRRESQHKHSTSNRVEKKESVQILEQEQSSYSSSSSSAGVSSEEAAGDELARSTRCKPRRARTYHGTADSQKSSSSSSATRRHTTVPKVGPNEEASSMGDEYTEKVNEQISRLPLRVGSKARRAATDLILENVSMRIENNKLRSEIALQDLHIASLRVKKTPVVETTEKLESLRQKHEEIQTQERDFRRQCERQMDELNRRREQIESREAELHERETQLKAFAEAAAANFSLSETSYENNSTSHGKNQRHSSSSSTHYQQQHSSSSSVAGTPLSNRSMTNPGGKLTNFRSGSAIHDLGSGSGTSTLSRNSYGSLEGGMERQTNSSTVPLSGSSMKSGVSPASELAQVPRHLAVKTETKSANDKRKKK